MKTPNLPCGIIRTAAGLAIGGIGLFRLFTHILGATEQLTHALDQTSAARMQLLWWIMMASSLSTRRLGPDLLSVLWPLLPCAVGSILLWSAAARRSRHNDPPCTQWV